MSHPRQPPNPYPGSYGGTPQETFLQQPAYGIGFGAAVQRAFRKYVVFGGRASLSEYWWFFLFNNLANIAMLCFFMAVTISTVDPGTEEIGALSIIAFLFWAGGSLALVLPSLAAASRRLHDANFSGLLLLLYLLPGLGSLVVTILCLFPSNPAGARFDQHSGPHPAGRPGGSWPQ